MTPYPDINTLLTQWVQGLKGVLGSKIVGLYLGGSLSYGDFVPDRSDIDLQAVVQSPLTEDEVKRIEQLHREVEQHCPRWANQVECSYVPLEFMRELTPPKAPRPWWGFGTLYAEAPAGNEWIINHYLLSKYGIVLDGPEFNKLIPRIAIQDVRQASGRDLFQEWVPKIHDVAWLSDGHHQSYLVLNLCRILHTVVTGEPASKRIAAEWAKAKYPQWKDLVEEAERWKHGDKMKRQGDVVTFLTFAVQAVNDTKLLL